MRHALLWAFLIGLGPTTALATPDADALASPKFHALLALGTQYRYGGSSPETGFDCSGLVAHVFERAWGVLLPRIAQEQATVGKPIRKIRDLQSGDLVFYNTRNAPFSHVGIYLGDGQFIHAPRPGQRVRMERLDSPYWKARFSGARRLAPPDS